MVEESTSSVPVPLLCLTSKICAEHYCLAVALGVSITVQRQGACRVWWCVRSAETLLGVRLQGGIG
jgi:hypothetical protein